MKKFLLFLILLIPIFNINALSLCDGSLPDINIDTSESGYIIYNYNDNVYLNVFPNYAYIYVIIGNDGNTIGNITDNSYILDNNTWVSTSKIENYDTLIYCSKSIDRYNNSDFSGTIFFDNGCENLPDSPVPTPDIPQDFSLINTIASYINDFVTGLQNNNISIHITFISLILFNFLVFVICYIITHLE